jgi:hypothetical protein
VNALTHNPEEQLSAKANAFLLRPKKLYINGQFLVRRRAGRDVRDRRSRFGDKYQSDFHLNSTEGQRQGYPLQTWPSEAIPAASRGGTTMSCPNDSGTIWNRLEVVGDHYNCCRFRKSLVICLLVSF